MLVIVIDSSTSPITITNYEHDYEGNGTEPRRGPLQPTRHSGTVKALRQERFDEFDDLAGDAFVLAGADVEHVEVDVLGLGVEEAG